MMNLQSESDLTLGMRFLARCLLFIFVPSFLWTTYLCIWYPVSFQAVAIRLGILGLLIAGGIALLLHFPLRNQPPLSWREWRYDLFHRIDGLMFFGSIPVLLLLLFFVAFFISELPNHTSSNTKFTPVKVRVNSIELKHLPPEFVPSDMLWKEVFYIPVRYSDLWAAMGEVTIQEMDGKIVEPTRRTARFTVPKTYSARVGRSKNNGMVNLHFVQHFKMDAVMDSERYRVGETYSGWVLRDVPSDVFFSLPSDRVVNDMILLVVLTMIVVVYLAVRISIGKKYRDKHWIKLRNIWFHKEVATKKVMSLPDLEVNMACADESYRDSSSNSQSKSSKRLKRRENKHGERNRVERKHNAKRS